MSNSDKPLISVIVPIYNTGNALDKCIKSILKQDYPLIEILLIDDGSTDEITLNICKEYSRLSNIKLILQENGGPSKARNTGIMQASGDFVAFVDSDDIIDSDAYTNLVNYAIKFNVPLVLGSLFYKGIINKSDGCLEDGVYNQIELLSYFLRGSWHSACTNLYSASLLKDVSFPINEINEDYIFNFNIFLKIERAAVLRKPFYHYIQHNASRTNLPVTKKHLDWIKHTQYVSDIIQKKFNTYLSFESELQYIFSNIVLANKCLLNMNDGFIEEPTYVYNVVSNNIKNWKKSVKNNPYISSKYKLMISLMKFSPRFYKFVILNGLKLKKWIH